MTCPGSASAQVFSHQHIRSRKIPGFPEISAPLLPMKHPAAGRPVSMNDVGRRDLFPIPPFRTSCQYTGNSHLPLKGRSLSSHSHARPLPEAIPARSRFFRRRPKMDRKGADLTVSAFRGVSMDNHHRPLRARKNFLSYMPPFSGDKTEPAGCSTSRRHHSFLPPALYSDPPAPYVLRLKTVQIKEPSPILAKIRFPGIPVGIAHVHDQMSRTVK